MSIKVLCRSEGQQWDGDTDALAHMCPPHLPKQESGPEKGERERGTEEAEG